jgi:hypothetical protein
VACMAARSSRYCLYGDVRDRSEALAAHQQRMIPMKRLVAEPGPYAMEHSVAAMGRTTRRGIR